MGRRKESEVSQKRQRREERKKKIGGDREKAREAERKRNK